MAKFGNFGPCFTFAKLRFSISKTGDGDFHLKLRKIDIISVAVITFSDITCILAIYLTLAMSVWCTHWFYKAMVKLLRYILLLVI